MNPPIKLHSVVAIVILVTTCIISYQCVENQKLSYDKRALIKMIFKCKTKNDFCLSKKLNKYDTFCGP